MLSHAISTVPPRTGDRAGNHVSDRMSPALGSKKPPARSRQPDLGQALDEATPQARDAAARGVPQSRDAAPAEQPRDGDPTVDLARIAWSITTVVFAVAGLVLLLQSYYGYASVTFAVAVAAGINVI